MANSVCREFLGPIGGGVLTQFLTFQTSTVVSQYNNILLVAFSFILSLIRYQMYITKLCYNTIIIIFSVRIQFLIFFITIFMLIERKPKK